MKYVYVRYSTKAKQIAVVLRTRERFGCKQVQLQKWRDNGQCWTQPAWYLDSIVLGPVDPKDPRLARIREVAQGRRPLSQYGNRG